MSAVAFPQTANYPQGHIENHDSRQKSEWIKAGVGATVLIGSLLLLGGKRKAGLVVTAAGTALALLEEKELVQKWWQELPSYLDNAQRLLDQAQTTVDDLTSKRDKLMSLFNR